MGNVSSLARASSALDSYVSELGTDISYEKSLSSSRFLKTILVRHAHGLLVLKLFIKPDPAISLRVIQQRLKKQRDVLNSIPNVLSYQTFVETDKAGYLIRQWAGSSLYDRISTRPYLAPIEKKWIAYQVLTALRDAREKDIAHGDLKSENILITPSLSVLVTDFASAFKPTYLPLNDPSDFSYFYDSSGRRTCYIAPERFYTDDSAIASEKRMSASVSGNDLGGSRLVSNAGIGKRDGRVTEEMDVFSAGCLLLEMWTDGNGVFALSELYAYREGISSGIQAVLDGLPDLAVKTLLASMIALDPADRPSFDQLLSDYRVKVFPEHFYAFLPDYTGIPVLPTSNAAPVRVEQPSPVPQASGRSDKLIELISSDWSGRIVTVLDEYAEETSDGQTSGRKSASEDGPALLLLNVITAEVRNCIRASSRIQALGPLQDLCPYLEDEDVLDRLLPYVLYLANDDLPQVRAESSRALAAMLSTVTSVSAANKDVMTDYILPNLRHLVYDEDISVRCAYAEVLPVLAEVGLNLLEIGQSAMDGDGNDPFELLAEEHIQEADYETTLAELQGAVEEQAGALLLDPSPIARRSALVNIARLSLFFGRSKTNDVLLSRMITYLNDKDWRLRYTFLENIVSVAALVGSTSLEEFVLPLMEQALADSEDQVVARVLQSLASLTELGLFCKARLWELISNAYGFLCHPSPGIRQACAAFLAVSAKQLPAGDVWCIAYPYIRPILTADASEFTESSLLDTAQTPVSRSVMDAARAWAGKSLAGPFWSTARTPRTFARNRGVFTMATAPPSRLAPLSAPTDVQQADMLRTRGMSEADERKIGALKDHIASQAAMTVERGDMSLSSSDGANLFPPGKMVSLTELQVTPQTVFIPVIRPLAEKASKYAGSHVSALDSRRSSMHRPTRTPRPSTGTPAHSVNLDPIESLQLVPSAGSLAGGTRTTSSKPQTEVEAPQSSTAASAHSGLDEQQRPAYAKSSLSRLSVGTTELAVSKAVPEVSAVRALAVGRLESSADMHTEDGASTPGSGTETPMQIGQPNQRQVPTATAPFVSSYEGKDPGTLALLQHVHAEVVRTSGPLIELGPYVSAMQAKRRTSVKSVQRATERGTDPTLLASLDVHHSPVIAVITSPDNLFFATCSANGSINIWDVSRLERSVSSKPRLAYQVPCHRLYAATGVANTHCIALATDEGFEIIRIFTSAANGHRRYSRVDRVRRYQAKAEEGHITCIKHYKTSDGSSYVLFGSAKGKIVVVDLRSMLVVQRVQLDITAGIPSSLALDAKATWVAVATVSGWICVVDLRFAVVLRAFVAGQDITACETHSGHHEADSRVTVAIEAAAGDRGDTFETLLKTYDVASGQLLQIWGIGSGRPGERAQLGSKASAVLPGSVASAIAAIATKTTGPTADRVDVVAQQLRDGQQIEGHSVRTMLHVDMPVPRPVSSSKADATAASETGKWLLTAGDDRIIRAWSLDHASQSMIVTGASRGSEAKYRSVNAEEQGYKIVQEIAAPSHSAGNSRSRVFHAQADDVGHARQLLRPHYDTITALGTCETPHSPATVVISGDRSGCVKVWRLGYD